ncbi:hypothetical protein PtB15_13B202 [Puccinia triticina]|nr:hypothetical protein PtB15_13B202 [Puccinia triticina]
MEDEKERLSIDLDMTPVVEEEDCDEDLDISEVGTLTWLVKIPKFLSERWLQQAQLSGPRTELGVMRVYEEDHTGKRKIELLLEDVPGLAPVPKQYKLDVRNAATTNLYVFDELSKPEPVASTSKPDPVESTSINKFDKPRRVRPKVARRPKLSGTIAHECQVSPVLDDNYRAVMRARQQKASQPKRTIQRVNQDIGTLNRMASGVTTHAQASKFAAFTRSVTKSQGTEKFTRMPRTELIDALFASFLRYDYWATKTLRAQVKQPEAYLKEVLSEIATLLKAGPYNGHWVLKPQYAELNRSKAAANFLTIHPLFQLFPSSPVPTSEHHAKYFTKNSYRLAIMSSGTPAISTPPSSDQPTDLPSPNLEFSSQGPSPMTMLTFFKGPSRNKKTENPVRKSICFGFVSNNPAQQQPPTRNADRPRVVTNWKSESETQREIAHSLDQPVFSSINRFSCPQTGERIEPLNLKSIPAEVLLPFGQRESEIFELLAERQNVGLYNRLKDRLQADDWSKFENDLLRASRSEMGDQEWIMAIRALIEPLDNNLWVSFRGLIGADGLDHQETSNVAMEHDWHVQPFKVRRSSFRSADGRRRRDSQHGRSFSESSLSGGFAGGESDLDSISVISQSPRARMESIKEQEGLEAEDSSVPFDNCPMLQTCSDSGDDEPDESHVLALKILDGPSDPHPSIDTSGKNAYCLLPHGLKYSFGQVIDHGLGLQSLNLPA